MLFRSIGLDLHLGGSSKFGFTPGEDMPVYNASDGYSTIQYANIASKWIMEHDEKTSPFFMYFAFQGAHSANNQFLQAPADLISRFDKTISSNTCGQYELPNDSSCNKAAMRKTVAATVVAIDDAVATVEAALRDKGILENTLIIFSSVRVRNQYPIFIHSFSCCNSNTRITEAPRTERTIT